MTIRLACASTFTMLGLACSSTASARVVVYMPVPVIYAPPRPVYYPVPVDSAHVTASQSATLPVAVPVTAVNLVSSVKPAPVPVALSTAAVAIAVVPAPISYSIVPSPTVTYAQPVMALPR